MNQHSTTTPFSLFAIVVACLFAACNNDKAGSGSGPNLPGSSLVGGKLDTLYTDSASFVKLPDTSKVVFAFIFKQNDTLTLHGWIAKNDTTFTTNPDIELKKHAPDTSLTYGIGTYFGNVVMKKKDVKEVKKLLDNKHAHTVLFAPKWVDGNHIGYDIGISKERPGIDQYLIVILTGTSANPSPPKGY